MLNFFKPLWLPIVFCLVSFMLGYYTCHQVSSNKPALPVDKPLVVINVDSTRITVNKRDSVVSIIRDTTNKSKIETYNLTPEQVAKEVEDILKEQ